MRLLYVSIVILFLLSSASVLGTVYFYTQLENEKNVTVVLERDTKELKERLTVKDETIKANKEKIAGLESQITQLKSDVEVKNTELVASRSALAEWQDKSKQWTEKLNILQKTKMQLEQRLQVFEPETSTSALAAGAVAVGSTLMAASQSESTEEAEVVQIGNVQGKIILVNREYGFVVVGVGKLDGVKLKDQFEIVRDGEAIAKVVVSKLYDSLSSCDVINQTDVSVREGDLARITII